MDIAFVTLVRMTYLASLSDDGQRLLAVAAVRLNHGARVRVASRRVLNEIHPDQAHLIREFRHFTGTTPAALITA